MKSFVFYLILIALFLAGMKLVCRQQQYTRSIQALARAQQTSIIDRPATDDTIIQPSSTGSQQPKKNIQVWAGRTLLVTFSSDPGVSKYHKSTPQHVLISAETKHDTPDGTCPFSGHYIHVTH